MIEEITGRPAESVEEFVARRSDLFGDIRVAAEAARDAAHRS